MDIASALSRIWEALLIRRSVPISSAAFFILLPQVTVAAQCLPPSPGPGFTYGGMRYFMTSKVYDPGPSLQETIISEYGAEAHLVEWETLKSVLSNPVQVQTFIEEVGVRLQLDGGACENVFISVNGQTELDGGKTFFTRHDGLKEPYAVYDQIGNHDIDLGEWKYYRAAALVVMPDDNQRSKQRVFDIFKVRAPLSGRIMGGLLAAGGVFVIMSGLALASIL